jgi:16S rRNA (uracil1498-N3)-methyltransferase
VDPSQRYDLPRLILPKEDYSDPTGIGETLMLSPGDTHYLRDVFRTRGGEHITVVLENMGCECVGEILAEGKTFGIKILDIHKVEPFHSPISALLYPLTKGETIEYAFEKCTELGVEQFIVWQGDRSIVRLKDPNDWEKKSERWRKILRGASQQSLRSTIPTLSYAPSLKVALEGISPQQLLFCSLKETTKGIADILGKGASYSIVVGPEGDFSETEFALLEQRGIPVTLGKLRLRSETAAVAAMAIAMGASTTASTAEP